MTGVHHLDRIVVPRAGEVVQDGREIRESEKSEFLSGAVAPLTRSTGRSRSVSRGRRDRRIPPLSQLSREKIRKRFEQRFTPRRMALEYLDAYRSLSLDLHHRKRAADGAPALRVAASKRPN